MKSRCSQRWLGTIARSLLLPVVALVLAFGCVTGRAQSTTQTLPLRTGWNSIHLDVEPTDGDPSQVFRGQPVESVWTFSSKLTAVDFIQDPNEPLWNRSSWRVWVPTNRIESFNNNLFKILGNRPYLVNVTGAPVSLVITGRPAFRPLGWVPDLYNLRGFALDATVRPTFANFFRPSRAHYNATTAQLQKIYRLNTIGQWQLAGANDLMEPGIAYWVFTSGGSDFLGPLGLAVDFGDGLNYGTSLTEQTLTLENLGTTTKNVVITDLSGGPNPLAVPVRGTNGAQSWTNLPQPHVVSVAPGKKEKVRMAVQRQKMNTKDFSTALRLSDGEGADFRVPVTASKTVAAGSDGSPPANATQESRSRAGLWVGTVTLNAVAEVNSGNLVTNAANQAVTRVGISTNPTPTRSELSLRLLLHVDANGTARLLKEVLQMWQDGTTTNNASGQAVTQTPGRFVLLTDDALIPQFKGAALRDGQSVGRRLSTAAYDWDGTNTFVVMNGNFAVSNRLTCTLGIQPNTPTNPFRHKYHPDHDNLNTRYDGFKQEAYPVARELALDLAVQDSTSLAPDYGYSVIAGTYREKFTGLHKEPLHVRGSFRLTRVATTGVLNQ